MAYKRDLLPSFAGINTFARAPQGAIQDLKPGDVALAGVAHDGTSSSRQGVRQGPRAIREASVDFIYQLQASSSKALVDVTSGRTLRLPSEMSLVDLGDLAVYPMDLDRTLSTCRTAISTVVEKGAFPVFLGGDHFITYPLFQGFVEGLGKKVGLIQLSSQLALAERDEAWGENWHGATLHRILDSGSVDGRNVVFVGTQGYISYKEWELARARGMTVITADSARADGPQKTAQRALDLAGDGCDAIYLSLDIGVIDSGYASGTGDIVIGGLTPVELLGLMRGFSGSSKIGALDVVEVAPALDIRGRSERLAAEAVIELIAPRVFGA